MTRRNRVWSIAVLTVGALATAPLLSACGAGQIAATADMVSAVQGASATTTITSDDPNWNDTTIAVRDATVDYNNPAGYPAGGTAPLSVYIVNNTPAAMSLVGVAATFTTPGTDATGTATVVLTGGPTPSPTATVAPSSAPPSAPVPSGSAKPGGSASSSPSPVVTTPPPPPPVGNATINLTIPQNPAPLTELTKANGTYLQLDKLSAPLAPGAIVHLIFTFMLGNGSTATIGEDPAQPLDVPFAPPNSPAPRAPISLSPLED